MAARSDLRAAECAAQSANHLYRAVAHPAAPDRNDCSRSPQALLCRCLPPCVGNPISEEYEYRAADWRSRLRPTECLALAPYTAIGRCGLAELRPLLQHAD